MEENSKKRKIEYKSKNDIEEVLINVEAYLTKPGLCKCGEKYTYEGLGVYRCKNCNSVFKNEYALVRDFVDENGTNYNILEISEKTGVPKRVIDVFIKDKRFMTVKKQRTCKICKAPIEKGNYCNKCALKQLQESFYEENYPKFSSRVVNNDMKGTMHYLNSENNEK